MKISYKPTHIFLLLLLCFCILIQTWAQPQSPIQNLNNELKKVLVIHSYNLELEWVKDMNKGIDKCFSESQFKNVIIEHEYFDAKRHPDKENIEAFGKVIKNKYKNKDEFDLIICCDDIAWDYANVSPDYPFIGIPVVFCGVNRDFYELGDLRNPTTGILETQAIEENFYQALNFHPATEKVFFVTERNNPLNKVIYEFLNKKVREQNPYLSLEVVGDVSISELSKQINVLPKNSLIFLTTFYIDRENQFIYTDQIMRIIREASEVPVYSTMDMFLGKGIVGGKLVSSGYEAYEAAQKGIRILQGETPSLVPITQTSRFRTVFDKKELDRLGIDLTELPEDAEVINMPTSFFHRYKIIILIALIFIILQIITAIMILYGRRREKAVKFNLRSSNEFLDLALETSKLCSLEWHLSSGFVYVGTFSHNSLNLFGDDSIIVASEIFRKIHYDDRKKSIDQLKKLIYGTEELGEVEFRYLEKDKNPLWLNAILRVVERSEDGTAEKIIVVLKDITRELAFKEELHKKSEKLLEAQHIAKLGFWEMSLSDLKMNFSPEGLHLLGLTDNENPVAFKKFLSLIKHEDQEKVCEHVNPTIGLFPESKDLVFGVWVGSEIRYLRSQLHIEEEETTIQPTHIGGTIVDVTQPKTSETEMRRREKWFRSIFELAPLGVVMINSKGEFTSFNNRFREMFRFQSINNEQVPLSVEGPSKIIPKDKELFQNILLGLRRNYTFEKQLKRQDNSNFWAEITLSGGFFETDDEAYAIAMVSDISERKKMLNSILASEKQYRTLIEAAEDRIALFDMNFKKILTNSAYYKELGYTEEQYDNYDFYELIHPDDRESVKMNLLNVFKSKDISFFYRIKNISEEYRVMHARAVLTSDDGGILVICRDITRLKETEKKLEEKAKQIFMAANLSKLGFAQYFPMRNIIQWSEEMYNILGVSDKRSITPREFFKMIHREDLKSSLNFFNQIFRNPNMEGTFDFRLLVEDQVHFVHTEVFHKIDQDSGESIIQCVAQDVSQLKKSETNHAESEKRLRSFFNNHSEAVGVIWFEPEMDRMMFQDCNPVFAKIFRSKEKEIIGRSLSVFYENTEEFLFDTYNRVFKSGEPVFIEKFMDDSKKWIEGNLFKISEHHVAGIFRDITYKKTAEQKIQRYQKRLEMTQKKARIGFYEIEPDQGNEILSKEVFQIFGLKSGEFSLRKFLYRIHEEDRVRLKKKYKKAVRKHSKKLKIECRVLIPGQEVKNVFSVTTLRYNDDGKIVGFTGWIQDISGHGETKKKMRQK